MPGTHDPRGLKGRYAVRAEPKLPGYVLRARLGRVASHPHVGAMGDVWIYGRGRHGGIPA